MDDGRHAVPDAFLSIIVGVGLVGTAYAALQIFSQDSKDGVLNAHVAFLQTPSAAIVFSVLFAAGALVAVRRMKIVWLVALLPLLVLSLVPVFSSNSRLANLPVGGIVAFQQTFSINGKGVACPLGWSPVMALAGRFPLGAGQGEGLQLRNVGDAPFGREQIQLQAENLPSHRHELPTDAFSGGIDTWHLTRTAGSDEGVGSRRAYGGYNGGDQPFDAMPPASVVQYCMLEGRE